MTTARKRGARLIAFVLGVAFVGAAVAVGLGWFLEFPPPAPGSELARRDDSLVWACRILLVLTLVWIAIGAIATRTTLVRRPGAAAARATWLSATRPWRARESMLGLLPLDRVMLLIVPAGLIIATRLVQGSLAAIGPALLQVAAVGTFAAVMALLVRPRSPWPVISAIGGVVVLFAAVELLAYSVAGPYAAWTWLWDASTLSRVLALTVVFGLIGWTMIAACGAAASQIGASRATGAALGAGGAAAMVLAGVTLLTGAASSGRIWQDDLIAVVVPPALIWTALAAAAVCTVVGVVLARRDVARDGGR